MSSTLRIFSYFLIFNMFQIGTITEAQTILSCQQLFSSKHEIVSESTPKIQRSLQLFKDQDFSKKYYQKVSDLKRGDEITMPSGRRFLIHKVLGQGGMTKVFDIGNGWALRLPLNGNKSENFNIDNARSTMNSFYKLQKELKANGVKVIEMNEALSEPPFGIVVKKEDFLFTAEEFFKDKKLSEQFMQQNPQAYANIKEKLLQFMDTTWAYQDIGDMSFTQISFNGHEWIFFDFYEYGGYGYRPLRNFSAGGIVMETRTIDLDGNYESRVMPKDFEQQAISRITEIRKRMQKQKNIRWFERFTPATTSEAEVIKQVTTNPLPAKYQVSFDPQDTFFSRDMMGFRPKSKELNLEFQQPLRETKDFAIYQIAINNQLQGVVYLPKTLQSYDQWALLQKPLLEKAKQSGTPYLVGDDFVLYFNPADSAQLEKIPEF